MEPNQVHQLLKQKHLAERFFKMIRKDGSRYVLIASSMIHEGKSTFFNLVRNSLDGQSNLKYKFISFHELPSIAPRSIKEDCTVVIDGPAMSEGDESLYFPIEWQQLIKAAVIVVMGRKTSMDRLKETISRLDAMDIRIIGAVFNELHIPCWAETKKQWKANFLGLFGKNSNPDQHAGKLKGYSEPNSLGSPSKAAVDLHGPTTGRVNPQGDPRTSRSICDTCYFQPKGLAIKMQNREKAQGDEPSNSPPLCDACFFQAQDAAAKMNRLTVIEPMERI